MKKLSTMMSLLFFIFGSAYLYATNKSLEQYFDEYADIIIEKIDNYIWTHPLDPYVPHSFIKAGAIGISIDYFLGETFEDENSLVMFIEGSFHNLNKPIKSKPIKYVFNININKIEHDAKIDLLCLTNDRFIRPKLFFDILNSPGLMHAFKEETTKYKNGTAQLFIDWIEESPKEGVCLQKWSFFDSNTTTDLFITLSDDGKGGTYFALTPLK